MQPASGDVGAVDDTAGALLYGDLPAEKRMSRFGRNILTSTPSFSASSLSSASIWSLIDSSKDARLAAKHSLPLSASSP